MVYFPTVLIFVLIPLLASEVAGMDWTLAVVTKAVDEIVKYKKAIDDVTKFEENLMNDDAFFRRQIASGYFQETMKRMKHIPESEVIPLLRSGPLAQAMERRRQQLWEEAMAAVKDTADENYPQKPPSDAQKKESITEKLNSMEFSNESVQKQHVKKLLQAVKLMD